MEKAEKPSSRMVTLRTPSLPSRVPCGFACYASPYGGLQFSLPGCFLAGNTRYFSKVSFSAKPQWSLLGGICRIALCVATGRRNYHWLAPGQMLDGLALAETTPGPLVMVLQFVGFVGAWKLPEPFIPVGAATLGAAITTWATFVPCFLWIFLGAPYIERLRGNIRLTAALSAITAAVVGVVLNLAVWFGLHVLVPSGHPVNWWGVGIALAAFAGMQRWKWDIIPVVGAAALFGLLRWILVS